MNSGLKLSGMLIFTLGALLLGGCSDDGTSEKSGTGGLDGTGGSGAGTGTGGTGADVGTGGDGGLGSGGAAGAGTGGAGGGLSGTGGAGGLGSGGTAGAGTGGAGGLSGTGGAGGPGSGGTAGAGTGGAGGGLMTCEVDSSGVCIFPDGGVEIQDPDGNPAICYFIQCEGRITACGDCEDNDGDGKIDVYDPECLGPCDNYEGPELFAGVGGEGAEQCKADCYFDFGNGAGNDDCHWSRSCDPLGPKTQCSYDADKLGGKDCPLPEQSELCNDFCAPLTPNGCDCFGCCTFPELTGRGPNGGPGYVYIGSEEGCTFDTVTDPSHCRACTPAASCLNTCEKCEICIGKPTIPDECFPPDPGGTGGAGGAGTGGAGGTGGTGGSAGSAGSAGTAGAGGSEPPPPPPPPRCPPGKQACGLPGDSPCPPGSFCITGCCADIVVQ